ncbi:Zinc finger, ZZ type [Marssonina coronariae]|uniref:Zinc finger, ZZ type n=1 Tax=Diplocarpon coronariae TaxID=2795749 RepID=A0A218ZBZ9_9HELO|nr:Zinc finger, ZZ type [Marssonina coronariae]
MSASSSAASSTLTRSRLVVFGAATFATATAVYFWYRSTAEQPVIDVDGTGLHRSNAVHRRRRRNTTNENAPGLDGRGVTGEDAAENDAEGTLVPPRLPRTLTDGETVIDDQAFAEEYGWTNLPHTYQRNGQNIVQLLFRVSEDATRRNAYVHRGCACNSCNVLPIRGIRYRCANCADYDLCEGCESQGLHTKTHIFYKIRVPASSFGPRHIQPVWYSGDPDSVMRVLPKEITTKLSRETGYERAELDAYWEQWTFLANTEWRDDPDDIGLAMDRRTFERCLVPTGGLKNTAPSLIFDRMFAFYDTNKDDLIGFSEFLHALAYRKKKEKWKRIFDGYDINGDGYVDRKDFLRVFRSYYVLHRQIHRNMVEGVEEQQMSSIEAHRLISGRQPLSSAFGQDGRYPRAPNPRTGEGKTVRSNGDQEITDGKGIMTESSNDTGNREDIFRRDVQQASRPWNQSPGRGGSWYWETIVNPPQTVEQMPDVLSNLQRARGHEVLRDEPESDSNSITASLIALDRPWRNNGQEDYGDLGEALFDPDADRGWPPTYVTITDADAEEIEGPGSTVATVRRESRRAVIQNAIYRERSQADAHKRWQRRSFYTDEEEGAVPPADWTEEEDILAENCVGESSKANSRPTVRSRSSSKVRFAEDMDDLDTRSNLSASSRSVPERWGGMEVPDAERDAGKEILYQITQQAFNELLDPLFKDKEDLAVKAAKLKPEREKWRDLYSTPEFEAWALARESEEKKTQEEPPRHMSQVQALSTTPIWPQFPEVDLEQIRERPLEDLLAATGYQVDESLANHDSDPPGLAEELALAAVAAERPAQQSSRDTADNTAPSISEARHATRNSPSSTEVLSIIAEYGDGHGLSTLHSTSQSTPPRSTPPESEYGSYRDPTMPQFRPDTEIAFNPTQDPRPTTNFIPLSAEEFEARELMRSKSDTPFADSSPPDYNGPTPEYMRVPRKPKKERLYEFWRLERASREAELMGGWGRLGVAEFERRVKMAGEGKGSRMDYLGSWIDFCIP